MKNPKNKGSSFERETCKKLSLWLTNGSRDDYLWRTQNSGGRFTQRIKEGLDTHQQYGDITSLHHSTDFFSKIFYVECKFYKNIDLWGLFLPKRESIIEKWYKKILDNIEGYSKVPLLIIKQNSKPVIWVTSRKGYDYIFSTLNILPVSIINSYHLDSREKLFIFNQEEILSVDSNAFAEYLKNNI